eukprot:m.478409 g.478409  ORF g.478409 m.478409 type:complete len:239 (-) comp46489_c0_seq1:311-1027(-)
MRYADAVPACYSRPNLHLSTQPIITTQISLGRVFPMWSSRRATNKTSATQFLRLGEQRWWVGRLQYFRQDALCWVSHESPTNPPRNGTGVSSKWRAGFPTSAGATTYCSRGHPQNTRGLSPTGASNSMRGDGNVATTSHPQRANASLPRERNDRGSVTAVSPEHPRNAARPIVDTPSGMWMLVRLAQFSNALSPISVTPVGITTDRRRSQLAKAVDSILTIVWGSTIEVRSVQLRKTR